MAGVRSRGQPLLVLGVLISGWIGARALAWNLLPEQPATAAQVVAVAPASIAQVAVHRASRQAGRAAPARSAAKAVVAPVVPLPTPLAPLPAVQAPLPPMTTANPVPRAPLPAAPADPGATPRMTTAGGHQLLWLAAAAMMPLPADVAARIAPPASPSRAPAPATLARWSADGWLYLRRGGGDPVTFPRLTTGGSYGSSQAGAVLRYRLAPADPHRPTLYLRGAAALNGTLEQEAAVGLAARPIAGLPVAAMAEARITRNAQGTTARPAVALVTELPPQKLPLGITADAYVQAGYVGGRSATAYVDGLIRAERPLATLAGTQIAAGGGVWGLGGEAARRGAGRCRPGCLGPLATWRYGERADRGRLEVPRGGTRTARLRAGVNLVGRILDPVPLTWNRHRPAPSARPPDSVPFGWPGRGGGPVPDLFQCN